MNQGLENGPTVSRGPPGQASGWEPGCRARGTAGPAQGLYDWRVGGPELVLAPGSVRLGLGLWARSSVPAPPLPPRLCQSRTSPCCLEPACAHPGSRCPSRCSSGGRAQAAPFPRALPLAGPGARQLRACGCRCVYLCTQAGAGPERPAVPPPQRGIGGGGGSRGGPGPPARLPYPAPPQLPWPVRAPPAAGMRLGSQAGLCERRAGQVSSAGPARLWG